MYSVSSGNIGVSKITGNAHCTYHYTNVAINKYFFDYSQYTYFIYTTYVSVILEKNIAIKKRL